MAKNSTSFQPGQSGNPKGRPPKNRALTALLEEAGKKRVFHDNKKIPGNKALAARLWEAFDTGEIVLRDKVLSMTAAEYLGMVRFLYGQVDGAPPEVIETPEDANLQPITVIEVNHEEDAGE